MPTLSRTGRLVLAWVLAGLLLVVFLVVGLSGKGDSGRVAPALPKELLAGPVTLATLRADAAGRPALGRVLLAGANPCQHEAPPGVERFARSPVGREEWWA